jgi:hypothetical protein
MMFGLVITGRLPTTDFQRISETQFLIEIGEVDDVNHIVVFMDGTIPFPQGYAGAGNKNKKKKRIKFQLITYANNYIR